MGAIRATLFYGSEKAKEMLKKEQAYPVDVGSTMSIIIISHNMTRESERSLRMHGQK